MSDLGPIPATLVDDSQPAPARGLQFSMRTALLLMVAIGMWAAYFAGRWDAARSRKDIERVLAFEEPFRVTNKSVISSMELYGVGVVNRWKVYVPDDAPYVLCLAQYTRPKGASPSARTVVQKYLETHPIGPGEHTVRFCQGGGNDEIVLRLDREQVASIPFRQRELLGFASYRRSPGVAETAPNLPCVLNYMIDLAETDGNTAQQGGNHPGFRVWIERAPEQPTKAPAAE